MQSRSNRDRIAFAAIVCAIVGVVAFSPSVFGQYPMDDEFIATATLEDGSPRPLVGRLGSLGDYFSTHWWLGHYAATDLFRPFTKLSYGLTTAVFGSFVEDPAFGQHVVNLLAYAWACALVPLLLIRLSASRGAALVGGLVFAVHTLHAEAVCTLTGRAEIFAFAAGLTATLLLLETARRNTAGARAGVSYVLASLLFFVAFCSKESGLAWVPVSAVLIVWRCGVRRLGIVGLTLLPALVCFFWLRARMIGALTEAVPPTNAYANPLVALGGVDRFACALRIFGFGVGRTLFPIRLSADHGPAVFDVSAGLASAGFWTTLVLLGVFVGAALRSVRTAPLFAIAIFVYGGFAFLTSNLAFPIGTIYGERLLFSPSLGFAIAIAALWKLAEDRRWPNVVVLIPLVLWLGHASVYSFRRSIWFESTATIAKHDVKVQPRSANLQRLASVAYVEEGDRGAAIEALEVATKISPGFAAGWLNLASLVRTGGDKARAIAILREALKVADRDPAVQLARLHASLATSLQGEGKFAEAERELERAIELDPESSDYPARLRKLRER